MWQRCPVEVLGHHELQGVVRRDDCRLEVAVGRITMAFSAGGEQGPVLPITAYLVPHDQVPLLLGFRDALTEFALFADYRTGQAYLTSDEAHVPALGL